MKRNDVYTLIFFVRKNRRLGLFAISIFIYSSSISYGSSRLLFIIIWEIFLFNFFFPERDSWILEVRRMEGEQLKEFLIGYLKKRGFNSAAKGLEEDLHHNNGSSSFTSIDYQNDPELTKLIRSFSQYYLLSFGFSF